MKIMHLADLHIGKRVNGFPMIEEQAYILKQIAEIAENKQIDAMIIAGDVYDKPVPSGEAIQLFDEFITSISKLGIKIFVISGNHDSGERLSFGSEIMSESGVHFSGSFEGSMKKVTLEDEFGPINVYMLPFVKPANVRTYFEEEIKSYNDAVKLIVNSTDIDCRDRNILVCHQFVTGATCCESEELSIGGLDNIDATIFDDFDYVALGHMHGPQKVGRDTVRYAGTPLKYSFSEVNHNKSVVVFDIKSKKDKGSFVECEIELIPLTPNKDMAEIQGMYMEVTSKAYYEDNECFDKEDYMHITLTDDEEIPDAIGKLRSIYPNIMKLTYKNKRTSIEGFDFECSDVKEKAPIEMFEEFYEKQNNQGVSEEQKAFLDELIEKIWEVKG